LSRYHALVASLPTLLFDAQPPMSHEKLRYYCQGVLSAADSDAFSRARLDVWNREPGEHPAVVRWYRWEISLRNALVRARAAARGGDADRYLKPIPKLPFENGGADTVETEAVARAAVAASSPLAGDEILDRARWALLDGLELGHPFALDVVIARSLKLQILERRAAATEARGRAALERIRESAAEKIRAGEALHG
jgi:hypothetical protein